jgi:hypothetical protein
MSGVALVQFSSLNLKELLPIGRQAFDRNLAEGADLQDLEPPLHHMLCVAAMKDPGVRTAEDCRPYIDLFHAGFFIACDERDAAEILSLAGMPSLMVDTVDRDVVTLFIAGSLAQWTAAVLRGCQSQVGREARHTFNLIYTKFKDVGLAGVFSVRSKPNTRDNTFLLEYKP